MRREVGRAVAAWYTRAAKAGLEEAQFNLGVCNANGEGVAANARTALAWFERAAAAGDANATAAAEQMRLRIARAP